MLFGKKINNNYCHLLRYAVMKTMMSSLLIAVSSPTAWMANKTIMHHQHLS